MNLKRELQFDNEAFNDFMDWLTQDKNIYLKIIKLLKDIRRTPLEGEGKPEALKHNLSGFWSRRITQEHRLVYEVTDEVIRVISVRDHY
ncbi:Txe/YoeB family addiction module toxin [Arcicella sp. LKC2W]|uniref:Txe/YoeB family addiction module toxin n=1 Tax=Arcicella sp. LKC2W TaxID=2984198 RepID=UPI002B207C59|nr:Txe/YoeB family addiction module toxin [Arcicella sp. LKC2W]MEA5460599.1 Txe/YoeB family addiction module toxin [Arcicella sp. LKC2W]